MHSVLRIESLELRRLRREMIYVYNVLSGLVDLNFNEHFMPMCMSPCVRR